MRVDRVMRWPAAVSGVLILGCLAWLAGGTSLPPRDDAREIGAAGAEVGDEPTSAAARPTSRLDSARSDESPGESSTPRDVLSEEFGRRPPREGTERAAFESFRDLARTDRAAFDVALNKTLTGDAPVHERVAALRAAWECDGAEALAWFRRVISEDRTGEATETCVLAEFAVRFVGRQAEQDAAARRFLEEQIAATGLRTALRAGAARSLYRWADDDELIRLEARLRDEPDRIVIGAALAGLGERRTARENRATAELARLHSDPELRAWASKRLDRRVDENDE